MSELLKNIIRFILFILIQVFILFKIPPLHRFITPYLYFLFILWLPFNMSRMSLMLVLCLRPCQRMPILRSAECTLKQSADKQRGC